MQRNKENNKYVYHVRLMIYVWSIGLTWALFAVILANMGFEKKNRNTCQNFRLMQETELQVFFLFVSIFEKIVTYC